MFIYYKLEDEIGLQWLTGQSSNWSDLQVQISLVGWLKHGTWQNGDHHGDGINLFILFVRGASLTKEAFVRGLTIGQILGLKSCLTVFTEMHESADMPQQLVYFIEKNREFINSFSTSAHQLYHIYHFLPI